MVLTPLRRTAGRRFSDSNEVFKCFLQLFCLHKTLFPLIKENEKSLIKNSLINSSDIVPFVAQYTFHSVSPSVRKLLIIKIKLVFGPPNLCELRLAFKIKKREQADLQLI